jgi:hypothetical protein
MKWRFNLLQINYTRYMEVKVYIDYNEETLKNSLVLEPDVEMPM